jgi:4'-phosphopantetheinyl transferase EntD
MAAGLASRVIQMSHSPVKASQRLASLFGSPVAAFETCAAVDPATLHAEEAACVARAAPRRVAQFAAGRACAHAALAQLGVAHAVLRVGPEREPLWPEGISGSITHTGDFGAAVAASRLQVSSLGIDAEERGAVRRELWRHIATAEERAWLESLPAQQMSDMSALLFSAKEAFFKCQYPLTRQWLGFADVGVSIEADCFRVLPRAALRLTAHAPPPWCGRFALDGALVLTGIALPASCGAPAQEPRV